MENRATELETRVQEAHERYVKSKGKNLTTRKPGKRSTSNRFNNNQESDYTTSGQP